MRPLVFVHGFMGGGDQWAGQVEAFEGRTVVTPDLPGFGAHAHLPAVNSIAGFADWVITRLKASGVCDYDLVGHSMGGMIVQEIARRDANAIGRLVLYGTGPTGALPGRFESIATSKARAAADGAEVTARRIAATWFLNGANDPAYGPCADIAALSRPEAISAGLDAMADWSGEDRLAEIRMPTLVLWGDGDRTYDWAQPQALWSGIPNAALAVVPGVAHAVHLEKPSLFNAILADFLSD